MACTSGREENFHARYFKRLLNKVAVSEETKGYDWYGEILRNTRRSLADFSCPVRGSRLPTRKPQIGGQGNTPATNASLMIRGQYALHSMPFGIVPRIRIESIVRDAVTVVYVPIKEAS